MTNSNAEVYGDRHLAGNCFATVNDFYDAMVSTIQVNYNAAWPSGKTGRCDFGSCYNATYVTTSSFAKQAYGQAAGQGQYNDCVEPSSPAAANGHGYCGLKRTDTTSWSCNTGSCLGWDGVVQVGVKRLRKVGSDRREIDLSWLSSPIEYRESLGLTA